MIYYDIYGPTKVCEKKFARIVEQNTVTEADIAHNIASRSTFKEHEVLPIIDCVSQELENALKAGNSVHIKGLGYFTLNIKGDIVTNENGTEVLRNAQVSEIHFRPEQQFLNRFFKIEVRRNKREGQSVVSLTDDKIVRTIARLTEQNGMFSPAQLESALNLRRKQVYPLLKRLVSEGRVEKISFGTRHNFYRAVEV